MGRFRSGSRVDPEPFTKKGNRNRTRFGTRKLVPEPDPVILIETGTRTGTVCEAGLVSVPGMVPVLVKKKVIKWLMLGFIWQGLANFKKNN